MSGFGPSFVLLSSIGDIEIDAVLSEEHIFDSDVTRNPVEDGTQYTDHTVLLPTVLQIEGRVSDTSLKYLDFVDLVSRSDRASRSREAFQKLVDMQNKKIPFSVYTGLSNYENMIFESLSFPRTSKDGFSIRFDAVMVELLIVGGDAKTNRDRIAKNVQHTAQPSKNTGYVQKVPA